MLPLKDQANLILQLSNHPGYKVLEDWMRGMEATYTQQLRHASKEDVEKLQGRLDSYEEIFTKINELCKLANKNDAN